MSYLPAVEAVVVSITVLLNYSVYTFFVEHKKSRGSSAQAKTPGGSKKGERKDKKHWLEERGSP
jgi:hypothetical protein